MMNQKEPVSHIRFQTILLFVSHVWLWSRMHCVKIHLSALFKSLNVKTLVHIIIRSHQVLALDSCAFNSVG